MAFGREITSKWPKQRPILSSEQQRRYSYWLGVMPSNFSGVTRFNSEYPLRSYCPGARTLEIGAGTGEHLRCENLEEQDIMLWTIAQMML